MVKWRLEERWRKSPALLYFNPSNQLKTVFFILCLLATLIYSNTFSSSFHFDDNTRIVDNPEIKHLSNFLDFSGNRYVGYLSFALNYHFGGLNVFGYHLVNLLIHITNGFLVYLLVLFLFKTPPMQTFPSAQSSPSSLLGNPTWIAFGAALLFVVHPIQTQAVTYIVQRFASLATLFYLLAVVLYLKWRLMQTGERYRFLWYMGALISTILGMKTKEITFTLPFILVLIEFVFFGLPLRKRWLSLIPFLMTLSIIPLSLPSLEGGFAQPTEKISRIDYLFTQFRVIVTYLRLLVFPVNQNLDYEYTIYHSLFQTEVLLSFLFLFSLFAISVYLCFSRRTVPLNLRLVGFGFLWFFVTISIESSIVPLGRVLFEHRLYLPSVGFLFAGSVVLLGGSYRRQIFGGSIVGVMVLILCIATYQRNLIWKDEISLWSDVVKKSPNNSLGHNNLGMALGLQGKIVEAVTHYKQALKIRPSYGDAHNNLGVALASQGSFEQAMTHYKMALKFNSGLVDAHNNLGVALASQGKREEAINHYHQALGIKPDFAKAHNNLGIAFDDQGQYEKAVFHLSQAVRFKSDYAKAHNNLGVVYLKVGQVNEAIKEFKIAIDLDPRFSGAKKNLERAVRTSR